jgi:integrase
VAKGVSPRAERLRRKAEAENERAETALSVEALVEEWAKLHLALRRERYRHEAQRAIRTVFAALLKRPAARVARAEVVDILDALVKKGRTAMAARALAYARAAFQWAMKRGKIAANPFVGLPIVTTTADRDRVLSDAELAEIWSAAKKMDYPWGGFFALAILTLQRREEVASMRWSEISPDFATWSIPASRMKSGKAHDVHLSEAARAVLHGLRQRKAARAALPGASEEADCEFVFSMTGKTPISGFSKAKATLDAAVAEARAAAAAERRCKAAPLPGWRLHDLRRTGASTLARIGVDSMVADKLLAHQPARLRGVAGVYQRYDFARERRHALDAWAAHVLSCGGPKGDVLPLKRRR